MRLNSSVFLHLNKVSYYLKIRVPLLLDLDTYRKKYQKQYLLIRYPNK